MTAAKHLKLATDNTALSAREELADAIERHRAALLAKAANKEANEQLSRKIWPLIEQVERGQAEVEEAKRRLIEHEMRKAYGADEPAPPSLKDVCAAAQEREDELSRLRMAQDSMETAAKELESTIMFAEWRLRERVSDVLREDPTVAVLLEKFHSAAGSVAILRQVLATLPHDALPRHYDRVDDEWHTRAYAEAVKWKVAIEAFSIDANASLPEV